jgi:hypothetical protein
VDKLRDYLRISESAEYLGVPSNTLRNGENAGKIVAQRHPVNTAASIAASKSPDPGGRSLIGGAAASPLFHPFGYGQELF